MPLNPTSSTLSFLLFPRAVGEFLSVDLCSFCIQASDLIDFLDHISLNGKFQALILPPDSMLGIAIVPLVGNPSSKFQVVGNSWWQLQVSICLESVCSPHTLRFADSTGYFMFNNCGPGSCIYLTRGHNFTKNLDLQ